MRRNAFLILFFLLIVSCAPRTPPAPDSASPSPIAPTEIPTALPMQRVDFTPSSADLPNPERGCHWGMELGEHELTASLSVPADLPPGEYALALWLPDPSVSLHIDPRYPIQFANENIWDAKHGWNALGGLTVQE